MHVRSFRLAGVVGIPLLSLIAAVSCSSRGGDAPLGAVAPIAAAPGARAGDPFAGLASPTVAPSATPYRFETGPRVPKPDNEVAVPFPPPTAPAPAATPTPRPLAIVRTQPASGGKGNEALIGAITATFNQPMIPLAALDDVKAATVPMQIEPKVKGRFRWLGTTTVSFEPEERLPFATHYTVTIPAGVHSALGTTLAKGKTWSFDTPRPEAVAFFPANGSHQATPDTVIAISFNQKIDIAKLEPKLSLVGPDGHVALEPVPASQWASIKGAGATLATWDAARSAVFRPKEPLAKDSGYSVEIAPGFDGGEGPRATTKRIRFGFRTYAPLKVTAIRCGWGRCDPGEAWQVEFNNNLSGEPLDEKITVTPKVEDLALTWWGGSTVQLAGSFAPATKYTVTVAAGVTDAYGQTLAEPVSRSHKTGDAYPRMDFGAQGVAVVEANGNRTLAVSLENVFDARARMVNVSPREWRTWKNRADRSPWFDNYSGRAPDPVPAGVRFAMNRALDLPSKRNEPRRVGLRLDDALGKKKTGLVWVDLYSNDLRHKDRYESPWRALLVEVTDIGLAVKYDPEKVVVFATSIETGMPMPGVDIAITEPGGKVWAKGKTNDDGMLEVPGVRLHPMDKATLLLTATKGDDVALVDLDGRGEQGWVGGYSYAKQSFPEKALRAFVFTDRGIYRPEETVHVKGILREHVEHPGGGIEALPGTATKATWSVRTPRGDELTKGEGTVDEFGTFTADIPIPRHADLGWYQLYGSVANLAGPASFHGSFQVQEYRTPEYKVSVDTGKGPWLFGQTLAATVHAGYYFGAPMPGAEVRWTLTRAQGFYAPPGNDGFSFGNRRWGYGWSLYGEGDFDESPRGRGWAWRRAAPVKPAAEGTGLLDEHGDLAIKALLERADPKNTNDTGPGAFTLEAQVFDKNRQAIAARSSFVVHPAEVYVGLRTTKSVIHEKEHVPLEAIATAIDGSRLEKDVAVRLVEERWKQTAEKLPDGTWKSNWTKTENEVGKCTVHTGKDPAGGMGAAGRPHSDDRREPERATKGGNTCELTAPRAGQFVLEGTTKDAAGREAITSIDVWVYGEGAVTWRLNDPSKIELVADKTEYRVGDVAKVLVKSPFPHGEGLLTFESNGMLDAKRAHFDGSAQVVEVPITEKDLPNVWVSLALARGRLKPEEMPEGAKDSEDLGRPAFATGEISLKVSLAPKTLTASVTPSRKEAGPGESIDLAVSLADASGAPVRGDAAVFLVDEGVLALLGYETPDPLGTFWSATAPGTALLDLRARLLKQEKKIQYAVNGVNLQTTTATTGMGRGGGGFAGDDAEADKDEAPMAQGAMAGPAAPRKSAEHSTRMAFAEKKIDGKLANAGEAATMAARTDFASTAYWAGNVTTGADGKATLHVKLPDNLTTFRIMVVAADRGDRFGHGDAQITVRKRLLVRPSLPRFLQYGDAFEASMVVHNETGKDGEVAVIARAANLAFDEAAEKKVFLKAGTSTEVRWKVHAVAAGEARVQFGASFDGASDAAELSIPVELPATSEAFATYGTTETSIAQPVLLPADAIPDFGALDVQTSSTALTTLGDAVDYLYSYPYECLEQTASRILPIVSLKDVIRDFHLGDAKTNAKADALAKDGIARIASLQGWDGGFKLWPESNRPDPWSSGYATFALLRAKENGYKVPETTLARAKQYLLQQGLHPPANWGEYWRRAVQAQSLMVLTEMGEKPASVADELYGARAKLSFFSRAELLVSLKRMYGAKDARVLELLRGIDDAAVQTPSTAHYAEVRTESRALKLLMHSEARTDAIVLWAMLEVRPNDPLIPKVVKGLNDSRVKGRWRTTQENAWVILAMSRYYHAYEKTAPEFVARAWLDDRFMGEAKFAGRSMDVKRITVPLSTFVASNANDIAARQPKNLVIAKEGPGRLYYRLGLTYAPTSLDLKPEEQGFSVTRVYEPVDDPKDVTRDADGAWKVKAGATVKVRLTIVVPDRAYYAAIVDPLPAGLEAVNTALATTAQSRPSGVEEAAYDTWSWYSFWAFDHVQMRDDRVELFADQLPAGVYEYTYLARATTYGKFVVPPLKAEEMYAPEVFGRNGTARVVVQ